jgi:uncharacterized phage protein (TIGR02218 family)
MKSASSALIDLLGSAQNLLVAEIVTITLADGTILHYTTGNQDITFASTLYTSKGALLQLGTISWRIGVEVDTLKLQIWSDLSNIVESVAVQHAALEGLLDSAGVLVQRLFTTTWGDWSAGAVTLFKGTVSDTTIDQAHIDMDIKSRKELLAIPFPYHVYGPSCRWPLYGTGCTVNPASFVVAGTVGASPIAMLFNSNLTQADGWFAQGYVIFTSGANTGINRGVRKYLNASGQILLWVPLPFAPAPGDTFNAYPGCDHTSATCSGKFSNLVNFGGFPSIPVPETAI